MAAASMMPAPIPDGEAEANAENNYLWPEAVKVAKAHKAHIMVAVMGKEEDMLELGKLYTKILACCCRQKYATGIYTSGVVFRPRFYEGFAEQMRKDELPIFNWIWFGLYQSKDGMCAYTYGMDVFGKDEMEVLDADAEPDELRDFLASLATYVLENDVELYEGETIGFSADDKHAITRSEALPARSDDSKNQLYPIVKNISARKTSSYLNSAIFSPTASMTAIPLQCTPQTIDDTDEVTGFVINRLRNKVCDYTIQKQDKKVTVFLKKTKRNDKKHPKQVVKYFLHLRCYFK